MYKEYIHFLGFPDGHIADLGAAEKRLAVVFIILSVTLGLVLILLSPVVRSRKAGKGLLVAVALYLLVLTSSLAMDYYRLHLENGTRG